MEEVTIFARKPSSGQKTRTEHNEANCAHPHCSDCKTRRGSKIGTRSERRAAKHSLAREEN